ncbi:glycoside hydrolase family 5 protein [Hebeloma cylindrosporum]|uniref:Glycoside hydrolase family 5 protein n=1 Tax=Hebeloma cylindrosporum TaxID=76867 RepID=A0A0C3BGA1_HEBCY|nr:glycoside hydrolase family 5 protein [Hebeloma cylindrosporum h7]
MPNIISKLKHRGGDDVPVCGHGAVPKNNYRYRQQRGVNLGSWFVLERWITDEPFRCAKDPAQSDLDIALGKEAKEILEHHWDTWIQESDWEWIENRGINTVRIPIGYYHICGADPAVLHRTDFQPFYDIFAGAWARITQAIEVAASYNIGVLLDLHAAPGKQNDDSHSGTYGKANLFNDRHNQSHTIHVLRCLLTQVHKFCKSHDPPLVNVVGIELLNEPSPPSDKVLQTWYKSAISDLHAIDPDMPLYMGECWRTEAYADFLSRHHEHSKNWPLTVLDHHLYRCFTYSDIVTSAEEHTKALTDLTASTPQMLASVAEKIGRAGGGIVIGEWSGALNPGSLSGKPNEQKEFINAQLQLFEKYCAGWFFWTYKKQHQGDTGWSFRDAVEAGVFPNFVGIKRRDVEVIDLNSLLEAREEARWDAWVCYVQYWAQIPGKYDHARFTYGFRAGWDDGYAFLLSTPPGSMTANEIGFKGAWARGCTSDHGRSYWEFETGFIQALEAVRRDYESRNWEKHVAEGFGRAY